MHWTGRFRKAGDRERNESNIRRLCGREELVKRQHGDVGTFAMAMPTATRDPSRPMRTQSRRRGWRA